MALLSLCIWVMNSLLSPALTCETDSRDALWDLLLKWVCLEEKILYHVVVLLAAVQLNWQRIRFLGEVLAVTLISVLWKHSYIISQKSSRESWISSPPRLKNVGRMHQSEPSDLKCSRNSFSVHAGFFLESANKRCLTKTTWAGWAALSAHTEMGSGNNTDCTAFWTLSLPWWETEDGAKLKNGHRGGWAPRISKWLSVALLVWK